MAITSQTYNGDGTTTDFVFTVPFLDITDIKASIGGADTTAFTATGSSGAVTVAFNTAPPIGLGNVEIRRETNNEQIQSNFQSGSALRASDFNNNFTQFQYVTQEAANSSNLALSLAREGDAVAGFKSAIEVANEAKSTANAASSVIGAAVPYTPIGTVGGIPGIPADGQRVEVFDSTSIENFTPLNGMPFGFVGSNQLVVRLQYIAADGAWDWQSYAVVDQDARYIIKSGPAGQDGQYLVTDSNGDAVWRSFETATQQADGLMASSDKTKLDGIESGAEVNVNADWNATTGDAWILNRPQLSLVATTGRYSDLTGAPTIPVNTSQLTNDQNFLEPTNSLDVTFSGANTFSGSVTLNSTFEIRRTDGNAASISFYCENTDNPHAVTLKAPPHSASATYTIEFPHSIGQSGQYLTTNGSGGTAWVTPFDEDYGSLSNLPTLSTLAGSGNWDDIVDKPSFASVATSGSYDDLSNKPALFDGSYPSLTNKPNFGSVATSNDYADLTNKPTLFSGSYADLTNKPGFGSVATSNDYNDLANLPSLFDGNYNSLSNLPNLGTVATSNDYTDLDNLPTLFSGSYTDLTNLPESINANTVTTASTAVNSNKRVALINTTSQDTAIKHSANLVFNPNSGDLLASGDITAFSDARLKTNVAVIDDALSKVQAINGVTFNRTDINVGRKQTGLIAQELQKVLPEAVVENDDGILTVAYGNVVGLLVQAIKELKSEVEGLKNATT